TRFRLAKSLTIMEGAVFVENRWEPNFVRYRRTGTDMSTAKPLLLLVIAFAFVPKTSAQQEAFDAASVKVNVMGSRGYPGLAPGGKRFTATNLPLTALVMLAYDTTPRQISGVPRFLDQEGYDIEATCERPMTKVQALRMLQTLLAERFKLTLHRE